LSHQPATLPTPNSSHEHQTPPHHHSPDHPPSTPLPQEATEALKPILGPYYCHDPRNVMVALWEETASCHYVAPDAPGSGVLWYRSLCDRKQE